MDKINQKKTVLKNALNKLYQSINNLKEFNIHSKTQSLNYLDNNSLKESLRDSVIQRFEFSVDLFWKYIKLLLEYQLKEPTELNSPRAIIESACKSKLISEKDAEEIIEMIKCRNKTSHIYQEEIAEQIARDIPNYYEIIKKYSK